MSSIIRRNSRMDFQALALQCAPTIHPATIQALVKTESGFNPFAIGVVGGRLERQPGNLDEAIATSKYLNAKGFNFSVGYTQVNKLNFSKYGLTIETAFEPCVNLYAGAEILKACFGSAKKKFANEQDALRAALSCYYSGNFSTGFAHGYVQKVVANASPAIMTPVPIKVISIPIVIPAKRDFQAKPSGDPGARSETPSATTALGARVSSAILID